MTTKQTAVEIRRLMVAAGIAPRDVSVRSDRTSVDVTIKNLAVGYEKIMGIAKPFERVRTDGGGEILQGGNFYVSVNHDWEMVSAFCDTVEKEIAGEVASKGFIDWKGMEIGKNSDGRFQVVAGSSSIDRNRCYTLNQAVDCAVRELLKTGITE